MRLEYQRHRPHQVRLRQTREYASRAAVDLWSIQNNVCGFAESTVLIVQNEMATECLTR